MFTTKAKWCMLYIKQWTTKRPPTVSNCKECDFFGGVVRAVGRATERNSSRIMHFNHLPNLDIFTLDTFPILNIRKPATATLTYFEWTRLTFALRRWRTVMWVDVLLQMWWWMKGIWMCVKLEKGDYIYMCCREKKQNILPVLPWWPFLLWGDWLSVSHSHRSVYMLCCCFHLLITVVQMLGNFIHMWLDSSIENWRGQF